MGQILNRIFRIAKSYTVPDSLDEANSTINSDDEELKRIIEELNNYKKENQQWQDKARRDSRQNKQEKSQNYEMNIENACRILGIDRNASVEQIKEAYKKRVKEYHPDKVETLGEELKELAQQKTQEINLAYEFLRKSRGF